MMNGGHEESSFLGVCFLPRFLRVEGNVTTARRVRGVCRSSNLFFLLFSLDCTPSSSSTAREESLQEKVNDEHSSQNNCPSSTTLAARIDMIPSLKREHTHSECHFSLERNIERWHYVCYTRVLRKGCCLSVAEYRGAVKRTTTMKRQENENNNCDKLSSDVIWILDFHSVFSLLDCSPRETTILQY